MAPTSRFVKRLVLKTCSSSEKTLMESIESESNSTKEREDILEEDYREFGIPSRVDSSETPALFTLNSMLWPAEVTTTSHALTSTLTSMLKNALMSATETTESGPRWLSRVLLILASSPQIELSPSTAARSGTSNQFQFLTHPPILTRELDPSLTWLSSSEIMMLM